MKIPGLFTGLLIAAALIISSCSKVEEPYVTYKSLSIDTVNHRFVLLEDFTGMKCPNCPPASELGEELQELYHGQVFMVQVHAGFYARPTQGIWTTDYRCATGDTWHNDANPESYPQGRVNRAPYKSKVMLGPDQWADAVAYQAGLPKAAILSVRNKVTAQGDSNVLSTRVQGQFLHKYPGNYNLCVVLLEDSLISPQQDGEKVDTNHVFMNLLRGSINGAYGELAMSGPDSLSRFTSREIEFTLNKNWKVKNLSTLAFLMNADTREVIHVIKKPLVTP